MERIELDKVTPLIRAEHAHRYRWAAALSRGRVLDAACGVGYGAEIVCAEARVKTYTGLDQSDEALKTATRDFAASNRTFVQGDVYSLPFADGSFDTVISLETLEHLDRPEVAMAEFKRVLAPGGVLLGSVPSKVFEDACRDAYGPNPFHQCEFDDERLRGLISSAFAHSEQWDCWLQIMSVLSPRAREGREGWHVDPAAPGMRRLGSILFAASESREALAHVEELSARTLYPATSVVEHERKTITWRDRSIRAQERTIEERTEHIKRLEHKLSSKSTEDAAAREVSRVTISKLEDRIKDFAAANARQTQMIDERVALIKKQDDLVAQRDAAILQHKNRLAELDQALAHARSRTETVQTQAAQEREKLQDQHRALTTRLSEVDKALAEEKAATANLTQAVTQTKAQLAESRTLVTHQAEMLEKRTAFMKTLEAMIAERDVAILNQTKMIQDRDGAIRNQTRMIDERDAAIKKQTEMIDARDGWIRNLRAEVAALKEDLSRQKSWSASLEVTLAERDVSLTQLESRVMERDTWLSTARGQYSDLMNNLDQPMFCLKRTARAMVKKVHRSPISNGDAEQLNGGMPR